MIDLENNDLSEVYLQMAINKANPGEIDSDGNYVFEVEASNENLDLQNQIVQQKALTGSKEYFLTNGVISDDHQHKTRDENGNVETHKDKIIGEPLKVWTDGSKTFVKGKLYGNNKYAKDYINLLKAGSTRVHASVGGIMPKVRKNADGTETVTSFMWNDLALTCSPVNWTVGSAKFAKSMSNVDFVKALTAGNGVDASAFEGGRAMQGEEKEDGIVNMLDTKTIEKSDEEIIQELVQTMTEEIIDSEDKMIEWLMNRGFDEDKARETAREIIKEGERKMAKGFFNSISSILNKSNDCKKSEVEEEKKTTASEDEETLDLEKDSKDDDSENKEEVKKCDMKKSIFDDDSELIPESNVEEEYSDATELFKSFNDDVTSSKAEIAELKVLVKSQNEEIEELQKSVKQCAEMIAAFGNMPETRTTVMQKSVDNGNSVTAGTITKDDFELFKKSMAAAFAESGKTMNDIMKSQRLNSAFQTKMKGGEISKSDWKDICDIVHKYGK